MRKLREEDKGNTDLLSKCCAAGERGVDPHADVLRLVWGQQLASFVSGNTHRRADSSHDRDYVPFQEGNSNRRGRDDLGRRREPVRGTLNHVVAELQRIQHAATSNIQAWIRITPC